ncbi:MAG: hypothetical protein HN842_04770, partial [Gammaproteobacteria bacterium]|nr:hypothetical protein [Gammaproteobacteria bacterium]
MNRTIQTLFTYLLLSILSSPVWASLDDGLVAYYPFDGNANDSSGNENNGTENGGVTYTTGVNGQAASFDGRNDYIRVNSIASISDSYTLSSWFYSGNLSTQAIISNGESFDTDISNFSIYLNVYCTSCVASWYESENDDDYKVTGNVDYLNAWHMATVTKTEDGSFKLFVDGILVDEESNQPNSP